MKKTAFRRLLQTSIPAALIATATIADAASITPLSHAPFIAGPAIGARPVLTRPNGFLRRFANSTPRTTFVAGGATLPALAYVGGNALTQNPALPASGSIFAEFATLTGVTTQYCQTGSGFGKRVFDGDGTTGGVNGACAALGTSPGATNGFGAPASLGLTDPDVTGSDAPLSQGEYTNFVNFRSAARGEAVEEPSIIGSVALLYNNPDLAGTQISLTSAQICSIYEGKITNWSQLGRKARALLVAYRSDGSGTTFAFSNHLLATCPGSGLNTSQNFTGATPPNVPVFPGTLPANFGGFSGNVGVTQGIVANAGTIGYVEAANAKSAVGGALQYAKVNNTDPIKDLPQTAQNYVYNASTITLDAAVVTTGGPATTSPLTGVSRSGCVYLAVPQAYANITKGYPIIAVTNFLFSSAGNGATNATNLQKLVMEVNTPTLFGSAITTVDKPSRAKGTGLTGYAALGKSFNAPLIAGAKNCIGV